MKLTAKEMAYLQMYGPDTYAINLPRGIGVSLEAKGLVEWVPGVFGGIDWRITDEGRRALTGGEVADEP